VEEDQQIPKIVFKYNPLGKTYPERQQER